MIPTAKLVDFREEDGWYSFQFTADGEDRYRVEEILRTVPLARRTYDPKTNTWELRVGANVERVLTETFTNGRECVDQIKTQ